MSNKKYIEFYAIAVNGDTVMMSNPQYDKDLGTYTKRVECNLPYNEYEKLKLQIAPEIARIGRLLDIQKSKNEEISTLKQELKSYFDDGVGAVMIDKLKEIRDCGDDVDDAVPYDYQYRINNLIIEIESFGKSKG